MSRRSETTGQRRRRRGEVPPEQERHTDVRRLVRIGLGVFGVLAIGTAVWILLPGSATYGGPLQDPSLGGGTVVGGKRGPDKPLSVGIFLPWNVGSENVVLDRLVPISASEDIRVVGAGVLPPEAGAIGSQGGYPPEGMLKPPPIRGYVIPPGANDLDSYQLVVGVSASASGVHSIPGFEIQYHVGGTSYRAVLLQGVWVCVPREEKPACPGKGKIEQEQRELRGSLLPLVDAPRR